ncbi:hypothetical protein EPN87_04190 [archaeon]|nr:MAG: hypothetical protein EPN87_04190 [archaeon]
MMEVVYLTSLVLILWMISKLLRHEAIFVPLPRETIRKMLKMARVKKTDILYDLGAGDGRIAIIAAKEFGCCAVGVERNRILCWLARRNAKRAGLDKKIKIIHGDLFKQDISDASVVTVYLSKKVNEQLKRKLGRLKGARIVSASHVFKGWKETTKVKTGHFYCYLYKV